MQTRYISCRHCSMQLEAPFSFARRVNYYPNRKLAFMPAKLQSVEIIFYYVHTRISSMKKNCVRQPTAKRYSYSNCLYEWRATKQHIPFSKTSCPVQSLAFLYNVKRLYKNVQEFVLSWFWDEHAGPV